MTRIKREGLTVPQVAARLGVGESVVRRFVAVGLLPALPREPGQWQRFHPDAVEQFMRVRAHAKGRRVPAVMRIWAKVVQDGNGCWTFTGALSHAGYGQIGTGRRGEPARNRHTHRVMYEEVFGPVPDGLDLDHLCRNRACCNPWHLEPVSTRVNVLRGVGFAARHARQTHCVNGHPFDEANTYRFSIPEKGIVSGRSCRRCHAIREAKRRARLRQRQAAIAHAA